MAGARVVKMVEGRMMFAGSVVLTEAAIILGAGLAGFLAVVTVLVFS